MERDAYIAISLWLGRVNVAKILYMYLSVSDENDTPELEFNILLGEVVI